jgi:hypothetical protein
MSIYNKVTVLLTNCAHLPAISYQLVCISQYYGNCHGNYRAFERMYIYVDDQIMLLGATWYVCAMNSTRC